MYLLRLQVKAFVVGALLNMLQNWCVSKVDQFDMKAHVRLPKKRERRTTTPTYSILPCDGRLPEQC